MYASFSFDLILILITKNFRPAMKRLFLYLSLACLTLFISLTSFTPDTSAGIIQDVLNRTNQFRKSKGLPDLVMLKELNGIARQHSEDMANGREGFGHSRFDKRTSLAKDEMKLIGRFGENVAYGATTAEQVMKMWINSPPHLRNLVGQYKYIGIGIAKNSQGVIYYTQFFAE